MKYVTLAADASDGSKATGYAFYLRSDFGTVKRAWFTEGITPIFQAEYTALLTGLQEAVHHAEENTKLIIYCDNKLCLQVVNNEFSSKTRQRYQDQIDEVAKLVAPFIEIETRHVKAHTQNRDLKKYYMNRWCDINARRQQRYLGTKPIREQLYGWAGTEEAKRTHNG